MSDYTIFEIAEKAGVSIATVSRAINNSNVIKESTKKKILKIVKEMDYHPNVNARRLVNKRSNNIGILFPYNKNIFLDWYLAELLNVLQLEINKHNMDFSIYFPEEKKQFTYERFFSEGRVDGLIIGGATLHDNAIQQLITKQKPFILLGSYTHNLKYNYIDVDNNLIIQEGLTFLYNNGHRIIGSLLENNDFSTGKDRTKTFLKLMKKYELPLYDDIILRDAGNFDSAYQNTLKILKSPHRPTAIFAMSDLRAAAAYKAIKDSNLKIPKDISVIGVNDIFLTKTLFSPELTTIKIPLKEMANLAVTNLMKMIHGEVKTITPQKLKSSLIIRKSVKQI